LWRFLACYACDAHINVLCSWRTFKFVAPHLAGTYIHTLGNSLLIFCCCACWAVILMLLSTVQALAPADAGELGDVLL
jgi:hypothetical protein